MAQHMLAVRVRGWTVRLQWWLRKEGERGNENGGEEEWKRQCRREKKYLGYDMVLEVYDITIEIR